MPSPNIPKELRAAWAAVKKSDIVDTLNAKGVQAKLCDERSGHIKVVGSVRPVNLYATTGTVNAEPYKKLGSINAKGMQPSRAIERVVAIANFGH
jgi:hypothetical protein